ncbi:hypothetical protein LINGRAHAP2_LOCUS14827 [Linum grandiflorum]
MNIHPIQVNTYPKQVHTFFSVDTVCRIRSIPLPVSSSSDCWIWHYSANGVFSTSSGFFLAQCHPLAKVAFLPPLLTALFGTRFGPFRFSLNYSSSYGVYFIAFSQLARACCTRMWILILYARPVSGLRNRLNIGSSPVRWLSTWVP